MLRIAILVVSLLHSPTSVLCRPSNLPTVLTPFSITPTVEVLQSPVTKVETISITPTNQYQYSGPAAAAVAVAGPVRASAGIPVVQRIESYSSGDSSNAEIRDLLRSLLFELRTGKPTTTVTTLSAPPSSGGYSTIRDSYSAPPRNTVTDFSAPTYPDSVSIARKPEKVVVVQKQPTQILTAEVPQVKEVVRTVYQPVYVPVQYQPEQVLTYAPSVPVAVPTRVKTGASAVAISTIHDSPAYTIQQQPAVYASAYPVQQYQQLVSTAAASATVLEGGYKK